MRRGEGPGYAGTDFQDRISLKTQVEARGLGAKEWPPAEQAVPPGKSVN